MTTQLEKCYQNRRIESPSARGFSLLEALVALVILSVGMLGVGGLFVESLQSGRDAIIRTKAVTIAADMADRIRSNRQGQGAYAGDPADNGCTDTNVAALTSCTPAQMAAHDLFLWQQLLAGTSTGIPGAVGTVTFDGTTTPPTYLISVNWTVAGETAQQTYRLTVQM